MISFDVFDVAKVEQGSLYKLSGKLGYSRSIDITTTKGEKASIVLYADSLDLLDVPAKGEATNVR